MTQSDAPTTGTSDDEAERFLGVFRETRERDGWRAAAPLIEQNWDLFALSHPESLLTAIRLLPSDAFIENPTWLIGVKYLDHLVAGTDPASFRRGYNTSTDMPTPDLELRERLIGLTGRIADTRTAGRVTEAAHAAVEARRILLRAKSDERAAVATTLPHLTIQWARAMDVGDHSMAFEVYEDTYEMSLLSKQPRVARRAAASLAWMYADQGHTAEARHWLERSTAIDAPTDRYDVPLFLTAALLATDKLDFAAALEHLAAAEKVSIGEYWAAHLWIRALACDSPEELIIVENAMAREIQRRPDGFAKTGANRRYLALTGWTVRHRQGRGAAPATIVHDQTADAFAAEHAYKQGLFTEALRLGSPFLTEATPPRIRAMALLVIAASRFRLGRADSGLDTFRLAHSLIEHESLFLTLVTINADDLHELSAASHREVSPDILRSLDRLRQAPRPVIPALTRREQEVLRLLPSGMSNTQIADSLYITLNTLKSTLRHLYRKLGVHDRQKASDIAHQLGLDQPTE